jgi:DNA-binding YbaB/EbfC family protein
MGQPNMRAIQQMQNRLQKIQEELAEMVVEGTAGGGAVVARVTGSREFRSIKIDPAAVDPEEVELLEEMIAAAITSAMEEAGRVGEQKMSVLTGGLNIPGLSF